MAARHSSLSATLEDRPRIMAPTVAALSPPNAWRWSPSLDQRSLASTAQSRARASSSVMWRKPPGRATS
eukprot:10379051-Lingulodinium_polyedra.AAC.1